MHLPIFKPSSTTNLPAFLALKRGYVTQRAFFFGAVLFRGWDVPSAGEFEAAVDALQLNSYDITGSAAPRTQIRDSVFTSNDAPSNETIPFHHELGQRIDPPEYIFFYCDTPSEVGGATPLVDSREIASWVRTKYPDAHKKIRKGVRYRRVMPEFDDPSSPIGRSWRSTLGIDDEADVAAAFDGDYAWKGTDLETITRPLPGVRINERGGPDVFVNSIVAARLGWDDKRNRGADAVQFVDGGRLSETFARDVERRMRDVSLVFQWEEGDVLMIDNSVTMHARDTFEPPRRILASVRGRPFCWRPQRDATILPSWDQMPRIGFGCWKLQTPEKSVLEALRLGYRHIDSASDYGNEPAVGRAIVHAMRENTVTRDDLWITSKLWCTDHRNVEAACRRSMRNIGTDYLDLYLLHFPISLQSSIHGGWTDDDGTVRHDRVSLQDTWRQMEELVRKGLVRNIGLCNVPCALLNDLLSYAQLPPSVMQVEIHPLNSQSNLVAYCRQRGLRVVAYSPLGDMSYEGRQLLGDKNIKRIADGHGVTPANAVLSWVRERTDAVVVRSETSQHMSENLHLIPTLNATEYACIDKLDNGLRFNDPGKFMRSWGDATPIFD